MLFRKLYDAVMRLAASRYAVLALGAVAFAEASFFPILPDAMLAPMVYAKPRNAWRYALICTVASVVGGMLGYAIGMFLQPLGLTILKLFGHPEGLAEFQKWFAKWGVWVILIKGLTPIPFKLVTIASGLAGFSFPMFVAASTVTRGGRFFVVAALVRKFGPAIQPVIERRLALFTGIVLAVVVLGVLMAALLH